MPQSQTAEVGKKLVELCRQGKHMEAINQLYDKDIVSLEAMSMPEMPSEMKGIDAIRKKNEWWAENNITNSGTVSEPMVNGDKFAVVFKMDNTEKKTGKRSNMEEVGLYTVKNGKIAKEEFFYQS